MAVTATRPKSLSRSISCAHAAARCSSRAAVQASRAASVFIVAIPKLTIKSGQAEAHKLAITAPAATIAMLANTSFRAVQGAGMLLRVDQVRAHKVLDHLGHQTDHGTLGRRDQVHDAVAARFGLQRAFDGVDLAPDTTHP